MAAGAADAGPGTAVPVELRRERRLVCVEYPGMVRDVSKMLPTLGGEEGVSRVRSWAPPEPRGRPGTESRRGGPPREVWFPWQQNLRRALGGALFGRRREIDRFPLGTEGKGPQGRPRGEAAVSIPASDEPQPRHPCRERSSPAAPQHVLGCHVLFPRSRKARHAEIKNH